MKRLSLTILLFAAASTLFAQDFSASFAPVNTPRDGAGLVGEGLNYGSWSATGGQIDFLGESFANAGAFLDVLQEPGFTAYNQNQYVWENAFIACLDAPASEFGLRITFEDNATVGGNTTFPSFLDGFTLVLFDASMQVIDTQFNVAGFERTDLMVTNNNGKIINQAAQWDVAGNVEASYVGWYFDDNPFNDSPENQKYGITCMNGIELIEVYAANGPINPGGNPVVPEAHHYGLAGALALLGMIVRRRLR